MGIFNLLRIARRKAFCLQHQNVCNDTLIIYTEGKGVIACAAGSHFGLFIRFIGFALLNALVDRLKMLEFLVVNAKQERWYLPIAVSMCTPVLNGKHC